MKIKEKTEVQEKIEKGEIRIENGRLVGLGVSAKDSIDIASLDGLFDISNRTDFAKLLDKLVMKAGSLCSYLHVNLVEDETIRCTVPDENEILNLYHLSNFFKA